MAVKWMGASAICGGRLREDGHVYDDLPEGTPSTVPVSEYEQLGIVRAVPKPVEKFSDKDEE